MGQTLEECAVKYRGFCKIYRPQPKQEKSYHWGSKLLPKVIKGKKKKTPPGQLRLPWAEWEPLTTEVQEVAQKFVLANCYDPKVAAQLF